MVVGKRKKRSQLDEEIAELYHQYTFVHKDWAYEQQRRINWIDECPVKVGKGEKKKSMEYGNSTIKPKNEGGKRYIKSLQKFWAALKYAIIPGLPYIHFLPLGQ